ncbi:hypothetical protein B0H63DRAFT_492388 [Podospora didyma]|uniref:SET domain-containing protein n=1 Tax=Podospora didyma TaxID=330526 RepID=A0AAE0NXN3_9PEZI|nr:hypothetical protein B0H63DRAFT_492388 [Podospora didyma]
MSDSGDSDYGDDGFTPSPRELIHTNPVLCKEILRAVTTAVPLDIRSSKIAGSSGSGVFVTKEIAEGREIYRSEPLMSAIDAGNESFCYYCLKDTKDEIRTGGTSAVGEPAKACLGCRVARFCSKGRQLRVRSLRKIAAGDELSICYVDPTIDVEMRREVLKHEHFFDCNCTRCKFEENEHKSLTKGPNNTSLSAFHAAQREMINLISSAVIAAKYPGLHKQFEDLDAVDTRLRTIMRRTFPISHWPNHIEPLPLARLSVSILYRDQDKLAPALRSVLRGKLMSRRRDGPEFVNEMLDVIRVLIVTGSLPPDAPTFENKAFPRLQDIRTVACGYLYETCREAGKAFGDDTEYVRGIGEVLKTMVNVRLGGLGKLATKEFEKEFDEAQGKLMQWATVPSAYGIVLSARTG